MTNKEQENELTNGKDVNNENITEEICNRHQDAYVTKTGRKVVKPNRLEYNKN